MRPLSLYIHIPFCQKKCHYCAFSSFAMGEEMFPIYLEALIKEISHQLEQYKTSHEVKSIFFGGGTPSLFSAERIAHILDSLGSQIQIPADIEITMEANPETVDINSLSGYRAAGVNRISFGVQSFHEKDRDFLNRHFDENVIVEAIENASQFFSEISLDLIFGLPNQSVTDWSANIHRALQLPITHLSMYELMFEDGTYATRQKEKLILPDESTILQMYAYNESVLPKNGFTHYEISNWHRGKPCLHNLLFWKGEDYRGFGLSAESLVGMTSITQTENLKHYIASPLTTRIEKKLTPEERAIIYTMNRLRLLEEGLDITTFETLFGQNIKMVLQETLSLFQEEIEKRGYRYILRKSAVAQLDNIIGTLSESLFTERKISFKLPMI